MGRGTGECPTGEYPQIAIVDWTPGEQVDTQVLKSELQELVDELDEAPGSGRLQADIDRWRGMLAQPLSAARLHRAIAFLLVKAKLKDIELDGADHATTLLNERTQTTSYQHHQYFTYTSSNGDETVCCRQCGRVKPRDELLQDLPCSGPAKLSLR